MNVYSIDAPTVHELPLEIWMIEAGIAKMAWGNDGYHVVLDDGTEGHQSEFCVQEGRLKKFTS